MPKRLTHSDSALWKRFVANVAPLWQEEDAPSSAAAATMRAAPAPQSTSHPISPAWEERFVAEMTGQTPTASASSSPALPAATSPLSADDLRDMNARDARRLRQGKLTVEATLDLHGETRETGYVQFQHFLATSRLRGLRVVRIITGYGKMQAGSGILRQELPRWINHPENKRQIIGYTHAPAHQGGTGAWHLLLKRSERVT